ncbi:hypothetical protein ANOM_008935 [Aspergillus nomiae NRRL 13137]|uniref:DNA mismatch repair protein HSM3 N-terminal domain-containing protein n=1 Tax=Aspergillus nomiae NRRL (strain ATCC 15546 / NRRL 13137 / CBS 260.88 / M93) TaxID=1509407 RepID=A0A0L1ITL9_ASPN3|nr:uncharacterized protein ANOM_008935 [Aspergillus nomiae NRRL 13137]KNG82834.1 hypothetical protein ANOM_008935 [Aspergillus nomiae NRRL 13137]
MALPSTYDEVKLHLQQVLRDPSIRLDIPIIDKLKLQLTESTDSSVPATLLPLISQLLPVLQEDPTPITSLAIKATAYTSFTDLRLVDPPIDFIAGFKAPSPPINSLALALLSKAGQTPSDAAIVAGDSELVASLVELWLSTSSTAVAQAAFDAIWALLEVDLTSPLENGEGANEGQEATGGQGLVWRRIFTDRDVYGRLFSLCSLTEDGPGSLSKRDKTVAQGRLMGFLTKAGNLRWDIISSSQIPDIETRYNSSSLLQFAACEMVDRTDVLMHMTLLNFFHDLLEIQAPGLTARSFVQAASTFSSPALDFLISYDIHSSLLDYYLDESKLDPVDLNYLCGPIMAYVAQYAELYPNHFLQNPKHLLDRILSRISASVTISSAQWAHGPVPSGQLNVLSCIPRVLLVDATKQGLNAVLALPTSPPNKEALDVLSKILHGPSKLYLADTMELNTSGQTATDWHKEAAAARILYFMYLNQHSTFWTDVVAAADILAMKDVSLAAISFMRAIITANWEKLSREVTSSVPGTSRYQLPSEQGLGSLSPASQGVLPSSGAWAALTPPALTVLLPYLFKAPRSYAEFVGGGAGDSQNAVWKVATAKYEVLVALHDHLKETGGEIAGFEDIMRTLQQRVNEGPWGPVTQSGNQVETVGL